MEKPVAKRTKPKHLICGTGWALLSVIACAYFGYRTYANISDAEYAWEHNWWNTFTWIIWVILTGSLMTETRCWRERIIFAILLLQFLLGAVFSTWTGATFNMIHNARWASLALWCIGALGSAVALLSSRRNSDGDAANA